MVLHVLSLFKYSKDKRMVLGGGERAAKVSHAQIASLNERVSKRVIFRLLSVHNSKVRFREHYNGSFYSFCTRQYESYICARH